MTDKIMVSCGLKQKEDGNMKTSFSLIGSACIPWKAEFYKANRLKFITI